MGGFNLSEKLGPLPLWGWAGLGLLAVLAFWYVKKAGPFAPSSGSGAGGQVGVTSDQQAGLLSALGALGALYGQQGQNIRNVGTGDQNGVNPTDPGPLNPSTLPPGQSGWNVVPSETSWGAGGQGMGPGEAVYQGSAPLVSMSGGIPSGADRGSSFNPGGASVPVYAGSTPGVA